VTLTGKAPINKASVFVYGSAVFEGEPAMISVQLQMDPQQRTGASIRSLFGTVLRDRETSPGSDQVAYVPALFADPDAHGCHPMTSSSQRDGTMYPEDRAFCSTPDDHQLWRKRAWALVEFGIYSKALLPDAVNILLVELKRAPCSPTPSMACKTNAPPKAMGEWSRQEQLGL
jgi:hypothetical protein